MVGKLEQSPYQLVALTKLLTSGIGGLLIADGVGVGKTVSASYIISYLRARRRGLHLVVSPPMLLPKWRAELREKFRIDSTPVRNEEELASLKVASEFPETPGDVYVMASSLLTRVAASSLEIPCCSVTIDEIHNLRNVETASHQAARSLVQKSEFRVGLSATPINNKLEDLSSELGILLPQFDPGVVEKVVTRLWRAEDYAMLSPVMTRFQKHRLGIHFARRQVEWEQLTFGQGYSDWVRKTVADLRGRPVRAGSFPLDTVSLFRLASSSPKAFGRAVGVETSGMDDPKARALEARLAQLSGQVIIFCEFQETAEYLAEVVSRRAIVITGKTPQFQRSSLLTAFAADPEATLIMTAVGSEGIDLQFCSQMINFDLNWNPMVLEQRAGRIDRRGQSKNEILILNFLVEGSIDERILAKLRTKLSVTAGSVLATLPLVGQTDEALYDSASLRKEDKAAIDLASVLQLNDGGIEQDYDIASQISRESTDPARLAIAEGPTRWLDPTIVAQLLAAGTRLRSEFENLQAVV